jgi:hypothetical protein
MALENWIHSTSPEDQVYFFMTASIICSHDYSTVENLTNPFGLELSWHGVNIAEGLKSFATAYRFTQNVSGKHSFGFNC